MANGDTEETGGQHAASAFGSVPRPDLPGRVLPRLGGGTAGRGLHRPHRPGHTSSYAVPRFPAALVVLLGALVAFYVLAAGAGPRVADHAGLLAIPAGPAAWALEVSAWTGRHVWAAVAGLAAVAVAGLVASAVRRLRPLVTALAVLATAVDVAFLAGLMVAFYSVPSRLGAQPW